MTGMTRDQAYALAALVRTLRPEWDEAGIIAALKTLAKADPFNTCLRAIRAAADPGAKTPGVIPTDGPHAQERITPEVQRPPRSGSDEECPRHIGKWAHNCPACRADELAGDDPVPTRQEILRRLAQEKRDREKHRDPSSPVALLRAEYAQATAANCRHGVRPTHCKDCKDMRPRSEGMPSAPEGDHGRVVGPGTGSEAATGTRRDLGPGEIGSVTEPQLTKMHILFHEGGITQREDYLEYVHATVGRRVETTKDLTRNEAHIVIEMLSAIIQKEGTTTT